MDKYKKEIVTRLAEDVYEDGLKPTVQATGQLLSYVPRLLNAALQRLEHKISHPKGAEQTPAQLPEEKNDGEPL